MNDIKNLAIAAREFRERLLNDPYRPAYHFAIPDDCGRPGDPNGAFFADGVYHLMYLYKNSNTEGFHWGHISSVDLLHWRHHSDALTVEDGDRGCYSGGAFVDDDGTAYLSFWKFPSKYFAKDNGGIAIAYSKPPYEKWERITPIAIESGREEWGITDIDIAGRTEHVCCADPSNIWKADGYYYMQAGNKPVLDKYGRNEDANIHYKGDWTDLFRSKDLKTWLFVHRFYVNDFNKNDWPNVTEDDMCPSFLPLYDAKSNGKKTDKWLQLFISHNKGCQYYIGRFENETFIPESHGRMSWIDNTYFAPEALIDDRGRHIIWTWLRDNPNQNDDFPNFGWSGVYAFPRCVWLENKELHMAPAEELDRLQYNHQIPKIHGDGSIDIKNGSSFRIKASIDMSSQSKAGFKIRVSRDKKTYTEIYFDKESYSLVMDTTNNGNYTRCAKEAAPFSLKETEKLSLDIFVDKSVIEVYANERQAICRRVYHDAPYDAIGVELIGSSDAISSIDVWEMASTNMY